jgi:Protein of unknown function (DUF1360)
MLGFVAEHRRSGRELPERLSTADLALLAAATQKLTRLIAKDRVTSFARAPFMRYTGEAGPGEVSEEPRGTGLRLAIGELVSCPFCLAVWVGGGLAGSHLRRPKETRWVATLLALVAASDVLQFAYVAAQERA